VTEFTSAADTVLSQFGREVEFTRSGEDPLDPFDAVVLDYGYGPTPPGWAGDPFFEGEAHHVEIKVRPADVGAEPTADDTFLFDGHECEIRTVHPIPPASSETSWWVCRCVAGQRGTFR